MDERVLIHEIKGVKYPMDERVLIQEVLKEMAEK